MVRPKSLSGYHFLRARREGVAAEISVLGERAEQPRYFTNFEKVS